MMSRPRSRQSSPIRQRRLAPVIPASNQSEQAARAGRHPLPARWVIHTVGPAWSGSEDRTERLESCYRRSLEVASDLGARSIAFPLISSGIYRWPVDDAVRVALRVLEPASDQFDLVRLVLFGADHYEVARAVAAELG